MSNTYKNLEVIFNILKLPLCLQSYNLSNSRVFQISIFNIF